MITVPRLRKRGQKGDRLLYESYYAVREEDIIMIYWQQVPAFAEMTRHAGMTWLYLITD
jgi:hypothetical protein